MFVLALNFSFIRSIFEDAKKDQISILFPIGCYLQASNFHTRLDYKSTCHSLCTQPCEAIPANGLTVLCHLVWNCASIYFQRPFRRILLRCAGDGRSLTEGTAAKFDVECQLCIHKNVLANFLQWNFWKILSYRKWAYDPHPGICTTDICWVPWHTLKVALRYSTVFPGGFNFICSMMSYRVPLNT